MKVYIGHYLINDSMIVKIWFKNLNDQNNRVNDPDVEGLPWRRNGDPKHRAKQVFDSVRRDA